MKVRLGITAVQCCVTFLALGMAKGATPDKLDKGFIVSAAVGDMTAAHEAQMAESQATRDDVKTFAKTLDQDRTEAYWHLGELAAKAGVNIPKGINTGRDRTIRTLEHAKGSGFDRQFIQDEIASHRRAIAEYQHEAAHGKDADVKAYASGMVTTLEKELHLAEECSKVHRKG